MRKPERVTATKNVLQMLDSTQ